MNHIYNKLKESTVNTVKLFSLDGIITFSKLVDVYDGDTCTMNILYNDDIIQMKCRMLGYDSPEMKPLKTVKDRDIIKIKANEAKNKLISFLSNNNNITQNNKLLLIKAGKFDKYGRLLITVYNNSDDNVEIKEFTFEESVNHLMIQEGFGYAYDGGKKN